jgi:hypothetical protein
MLNPTENRMKEEEEKHVCLHNLTLFSEKKQEIWERLPNKNHS